MSYNNGMSNDGFSHIIAQIFKEVMVEQPEPREVWEKRTKNSHRYKINTVPKGLISKGVIPVKKVEIENNLEWVAW